jgi:signal transduction histidine kinase/ActR/RegA family two-component response regulator
MTPERHARRTLVIALCAACLVIGSLAVALNNERVADQRAVADASAQAAVLAQTATAALSFGDRAALAQYVGALKANPAIDAAGVFDSSGQRLAAYGHADFPAAMVSGSGAYVVDGESVVAAPVLLDGARIGTVVLRQRMEPIAQRLLHFVAPAFLVLMALAMFVVARIDAATLSRANDELRRQIAERERVEAALRQSQKMEAVGRLTGGIAHDFNNMLAIVIGSLDLLQRRLAGEDPRVARLADAALDGAQRAASLTQRLLAFSRLQPLRPEPVNVERMLRNMAELLRRTLGETIVIETVVAGGLWRALIDPPQLESALLNLAINARDAMPNGGKLTIEAGNAYLDRGYAEREDVEPGQYVVVAMTDTGAGIPADLLEQVFEPFFTTKAPGMGTGLGLSQVLGFIKQSKGHVRLYSEVGVGTTLKLYLPRAHAEAAPQVAAGAPPPRSAARDVAVLVVEDEAGVRDFVVQALGDLGYEAIAAGEPDMALDLLQRRGDVRILLTDVVMPGMSGRALAEAALRLRPSLQVVFMTGYTRNAIVHNGMLDPNTRLISKPFTVAELSQELEAALRTAQRPGP